MKICLCQINSTVGDLDGNAKKIKEKLKLASSRNIDLVVFPELCLTGYPPEDLLLKPHFIARNLHWLKKIASSVKSNFAVVGFVDRKHGKIYNAAALLHGGRIIYVYHKIKLPNYGVFDEKRYFESGQNIPVCDIKGKRVSISICEDIWDKNFIKFLSKQKIEIALNISASPFYLGKLFIRKKTVSHLAASTNSFVFYCNSVGGQDELVFDGSSMIVSPRGKIVSMAKRFEEDMLIFDTKNLTGGNARKAEENKIEDAYKALLLGLKDYVQKNEFAKVIIGISGGIDSALTAALSCDALGNKNVVGIIMPSMYTSKETLADAIKLSQKLNIEYHIIDIADTFDTITRRINPHIGTHKKEIAYENLQARIRAVILMAFSNNFNYLLVNTGNKSEVSTGYCTLYGDMAGGFGLLKDVPKTLVYKIAKFINKKNRKEIILSSILHRAPTAELKPNQKDQDTLPPYSILDKILSLYIEGDKSADEIIAKGFSGESVKKVIKMVDKSEYKRRQSPPGIKITPKAFGKDRRMPITSKFFM